mmetsp:Transcript_42724/g.104284  ORF Transcript_42724/g.104284 Transcript_42724/m.104284 type:complete len:476 (-) Transcript_42724:298-1725(-)
MSTEPPLPHHGSSIASGEVANILAVAQARNRAKRSSIDGEEVLPGDDRDNLKSVEEGEDIAGMVGAKKRPEQDEDEDTPALSWHARALGCLVVWVSGGRIHAEGEEEHKQVRLVGKLEMLIRLWTQVNLVALLGSLLYLILQRYWVSLVLFGGIASANVLLVTVRFLGTTCKLPLSLTVSTFVALLIGLTLAGPVGIFLAKGASLQFGNELFTSLLAPVASLLLLHWHPVAVSAGVLMARQVSTIVLISYEDYFNEHPWWQRLQDTSIGPIEEEAGATIIPHLATAVIVSWVFVHAQEDFDDWSESVAAARKRQDRACECTKNLVETLVPDQLVNRKGGAPFPWETPSTWSSLPPVWHRDCSVLQMDIKGFTDLSSQVTAEELVDLINAVFSMVDEAAFCIGCVWKVETIGDCYKGLVGGVEPCDDHPTRATALACAIVDIVAKIAKRLDLALTCRCGVNTGEVMGSMMAAELPR